MTSGRCAVLDHGAPKCRRQDDAGTPPFRPGGLKARAGPGAGPGPRARAIADENGDLKWA